jgi:ZIP family zinc transporter
MGQGRGPGVPSSRIDPSRVVTSGAPSGRIADVLEAAAWGFVGGGALLVGALIGLFAAVPVRVVGLVMGFGVGVLISAVAFELTGEAYDRSGAIPVVLGLSAGAVTFFSGDWLLEHTGAANRKDPTGTQSENRAGRDAGSSASTALVLGALLDGIPESAAIGVSLLGGGSVGLAVVIAVFLSNIPESLSASAGMKRDGRSVSYVLRLWVLVVLASTIAAALGYGLLGGAGETTLAFTETFAAGAVLTMLADTMVPEAVEHAGPAVGLACVTGFTCSFLLSMIGGG